MGVLGARFLGGAAPAIIDRNWPARPGYNGECLWPAGQTQNPQNNTVPAGRLHIIPYDLQEAMTLVRAGWGMSAAAAQETRVRWGLFDVDKAFLATLLLDIGEYVVANGQAAMEIFSPNWSRQGGRGRTWLGTLTDGVLTGATMTSASPPLDLPASNSPGVSMAGAGGLFANHPYGPMPATKQMAIGYVGSIRPMLCGLYVGSVP